MEMNKESVFAIRQETTVSYADSNVQVSFDSGREDAKRWVAKARYPLRRGGDDALMTEIERANRDGWNSVADELEGN